MTDSDINKEDEEFNNYSEEEEDDYDGLLKKALDVKLPKDFNPNKIPETGEEYLQHVIYERRQCKTWVTSNLDYTKFQNNQTFKLNMESKPNTPKNLMPSDDWQTKTIEDFKKFRDYMKYIRSIRNQPSEITTFDEEVFFNRCLLKYPIYSHISKYAQCAKIRMLQLICKNISKENFNNNLGTWVFALLVSLDIPLSPSSCYNLREMCKKLIDIRATLEISDELSISLNLFICILGRFFDQLDLADPYLQIESNPIVGGVR